MKILFIGNDASRTGAPIGLLRLLRWLKHDSGIQFELLLRIGGGPLTSDYEELCDVTAYSDLTCGRNSLQRLARRAGITTLGGRSCLSPVERIFKDRGIDLIYSNTITNGGVLADLAMLGCPAICHAHELESVIQKYGPSNMRNVSKYTARYIAASGATRDNLVRSHGIPGDAIDIEYEVIDPAESIPTAAMIAEVRRQLCIDEGTFVVGGSGYRYRRKGKDLFVKMASCVREKIGGPTVFIWVGGEEDGEEADRFRSDIERAGLAEMMRVVPHVEGPGPYYALFDVLALTSREDPLAIVALEAASLGVPVVCFESGGGAKEFVEGDAGFVVPGLDAEAMAEEIRQLAGDLERRNSLGARAKDKVRERHDVNVVGPRILEIITQVEAQRRA